MKLIRFITMVGAIGTFVIPAQCPAGSRNVVVGFQLVANPTYSGLLNSVLPANANPASAHDGDSFFQWNGVTFDVATFFEGFGWADQGGNPSLLFWTAAAADWYYSQSSTPLNFDADPPQPVPNVHVGYNYLGNVSTNVVGYNDIALGQLDPTVCPAYRWNTTTTNLDAYYYGVGPALTVDPGEGVIFLKPPALNITPSPTNSNQLVVTWDGQGQCTTTLETTSFLSGPWTTISNASSPYLINRFETNALFFRVSVPPPPRP